MMRWVATVFAVVMVAVGIIGVASPTQLVDIAMSLQSTAALYIVAVARVVFGGVLIAAAATARMPRTVRTLGVIFILAGIITPIIGVERSRAIMEWWSAHGTTFMRIWSIFPIILGGFIIYAVTPTRRNA